MREWDPGWLRQVWPRNAEASLPGILKAGSRNCIKPKFRSESTLGGGHGRSGQTLQPAWHADKRLSAQRLSGGFCSLGLAGSPTGPCSQRSGGLDSARSPLYNPDFPSLDSQAGQAAGAAHGMLWGTQCRRAELPQTLPLLQFSSNATALDKCARQTTGPEWPVPSGHTAEQRNGGPQAWLSRPWNPATVLSAP